jgi:hypothetical protein
MYWPPTASYVIPVNWIGAGGPSGAGHAGETHVPFVHVRSGDGQVVAHVIPHIDGAS